MSGPQDMQRIGQMFGGPAGAQARPGGPKPTMPIGQSAKRMGDSRVPQSRDIPQRNPGAVQTQAAVKLGVRPNQVEPVPRQAAAKPQPQASRTQAPTQPPAAQPQARPQPKVNPVVTALEKRMPPVPMPPSDPRRGENAPLQDASLGADIQSLLEPRREEYGPTYTPPSGMQARREAANAGKRSMSSAEASPGSQGSSAPIPGMPNPPLPDVPMPRPKPQELIQLMADAARQKAVQGTPSTPSVPQMTPTAPVPQVQPAPQPPAATQPKPVITNPTPPGTPPKPPEAFDPSKGTFGGYRVIPRTDDKIRKGNEKQVVNRPAKGNSEFFFTRAGPDIHDNAALYKAIRALQAKADDPKTAKNMTVEDDRRLVQYGDVLPGAHNRSLLSMEPAAVEARMNRYRSGSSPGGPPSQPTVPKTTPGRPVDKAEALKNDAVQNPPPRNLNPETPTKGDDGKYYWPDGTPATVDEQ